MNGWPTPEQAANMLSDALDEIYALRRAMAYEARVVEAHYEGYKTFPKTRRKVAEEQVARMRAAVQSAPFAYAATNSESLRREARNCGMDTLTSYDWFEECEARRAAR